ncbi:MAG TPA: RagB/SusD family nutrient uptake outer membrane protein [Gemmatimonadaceae bacterium]
MSMTFTHSSHFGHRNGARAFRTIAGAASLLLAVASCRQSDLNIVNPNSPSPTGAAADPTAFQLFATGLMGDQRGTRSGFITSTGALGRENYNFSPQEGRFATHPIVGITIGGIQQLDPTSTYFGNIWGGQYGALRDIYNFKKTITLNQSLTAAQQASSLGFAQTIESMMIFELLQVHDTLGVVVQLTDDPTAPAPFVSRDSGYKYVMNTLDAAATNLAAGGSTFAFTLASGFTGFTTPTTFLQFNRAIKAKAAAHYATAGGGASAWQTCLTALQASFLNAGATTRAALDVGAYDTYAASPDSPNGLTQATNTNLYAHMSFQTDAQLKANGQPDDRYTAKIRTGLPSRQGPPTGSGPTTGSSTLGFSIWPTVSSSIPIIRNEELILIRAEAKLATGDRAGAIADLNVVRVNSGGLPPSTLTASSSADDILTGILYEKRYSLMMEGDRWVDMRRYGRLNQLPLDVASGPNKNFVATVEPIPSSECQVRKGLGAEYQGPTGLNDCP